MACPSVKVKRAVGRIKGRQRKMNKRVKRIKLRKKRARR